MSYWQEKIKIGNLEVPRFIGGPLDGITDSPFRKLVRGYSKEELLYGEMRHVACVANDRGRVKALAFEQLERPFTFQVSASKTEFIKQACEKIVASGVDCLDLNIGCPARNVVKSGAGSSLMSDLPRLKTILETFRSSLEIPFTVKIRAGYKHQNAVDVAKLIQDCGADALAIHPRLQTQMFTGSPDYNLAGLVKKAVSIPVLLSGGIVNWTTAQLAYEQSGVDGYLIGRGLWSKPWKLHELKENAAGRIFKPTDEEILGCSLAHLDSMLDYYGSHGLFAFRKHLPFYIKGGSDASAVRAILVRSVSVDEVKEGLRKFFTGENS